AGLVEIRPVVQKIPSCLQPGVGDTRDAGKSTRALWKRWHECAVRKARHHARRWLNALRRPLIERVPQRALDGRRVERIGLCLAAHAGNLRTVLLAGYEVD